MKMLLCLSSVAWVFSIHSVKLETNQRSFQQARTEKRFRFTNSNPMIPHLPEKTLDKVQETFGHSSLSQMQYLTNSLTPNEQKRINVFMQTIQFDREGVSLFLNQTFNNKDYYLEFLPYSFTHLTQFIDFSHTSKQSIIFLEGAFRLFLQKLKSVPFVTAATVERFLDQNQQPLILDLAYQEVSLWQQFKKIISLGFKEKFLLVKEDPFGFFEYISKNLAEQVTISVTTPERVRMTFLRFLQLSLDKLMWSHTDQEKTWYLFKKLGAHISILHTQKVIHDELDVNDLYWSLIERYCYFLRLCGTRLTLETCAFIKEDLLKNEYPWLNHKEQETGLTTKRERLTTALLEVEAKIYANKQGFVTDILPRRL